MIGNYWSTGIRLDWSPYDNLWRAVVQFEDDGILQDGSTRGYLRTRYARPLAQTIDIIKANAEKLGIEWRMFPDDKPRLYIHQDGYDPDYEYAPNWRRLLNEQAQRIGWQTYE